MDTLTLPPRKIVEKWFALLPEERPELLLPSQYLMLGVELSELLHLPPPAPEPLADLLRLLRDHAPGLLGYARLLAEESPLGRHAVLELAVDILVAADGWQHPSQVLARPRPPYRELVPLCRERLRRAADAARPHLGEVTVKVETAARIEQEAEAQVRRRRRHGS
ncbi:MAG: hypothetical protein V3T72_01385 [Thermoanaerobaculia bacterium]